MPAVPPYPFRHHQLFVTRVPAHPRTFHARVCLRRTFFVPPSSLPPVFPVTRALLRPRAPRARDGTVRSPGVSSPIKPGERLRNRSNRDWQEAAASLADDGGSRRCCRLPNPYIINENMIDISKHFPRDIYRGRAARPAYRCRICDLSRLSTATFIQM